MAPAPAPCPRFQDLPPVLHREIASNLHAHEALAAGATSHEMQTVYLATITHITVRPQLLSEYAPNEKLSARDRDAWYLDRHGSSLARLLARLPCLKVLSRFITLRKVVHRAILLQPCPQLVIVDGCWSSGRNSKACPYRECVNRGAGAASILPPLPGDLSDEEEYLEDPHGRGPNG